MSPVSSPSEILALDHRAMDRLFHDLETALERKNFVEIYSYIDMIWMRLAVHIRSEHKVIFPAVIHHLDTTAPADAGEIRKLIEALRKEHDLFMTELAHAIGFLRGSAWHTGCPDCTTEFAGVEQRAALVKKRLVPHNDLEEETIYAIADRLPEADKGVMSLKIYDELDALPDRFRTGAERP